MNGNRAFVLDSYALQKLTFTAAHLKAQHPISYADALALAQQKQAVLLTGDPEFHKVESLVTIEWLPQD